MSAFMRMVCDDEEKAADGPPFASVRVIPSVARQTLRAMGSHVASPGKMITTAMPVT